MNLKFAFVGLPNVGKSTLFNALTNANIKALNFPFCTIKPNIGVVIIPDLRIQQLAKIVRTNNIIYNTMEFVDIAGLVEGSSKGEGMGNQFLTNIRHTAAIGHIVRCFDDDNIIHVSGIVNPTKDINIINTELLLSDLEICEKVIHKIKNNFKRYNNSSMEISVLEKCLLHFNNGHVLRTLDLNNEEIKSIHYLNFLTLKPVIYIANINKDGLKNNPYLDEVKTIAVIENSPIVILCAKKEANVASCIKNSKDDAFMFDRYLDMPGIKQLINTSYNLLNLQTFFTVGIKEIRSWPMLTGSTALQAASRIHSSFGKGFIRAKTISFMDFITYHGELGAKKNGKVRYEGKNYIIQDGDIMHFLFNI